MFDTGNTAPFNQENRDGVSKVDGAWNDVRAQLQKELGSAAYNSWIAQLSLVSVSQGVLSLSAPTRFMRDWVNTHYIGRIRQLWDQRVVQVSRVDVSVGALDIPAPAPQPAASNTDSEAVTLSSPLDARFTFDNYVTGASNEMAFAAARKVAESDKAAFSPLFIYGGVGLGKTHLMQSIAWEISARTPDRKVVYMSAERFMYQFVRALRQKDTVTFKEQLRTADVLLIDDLQFICGKEATQEEFFHTFNALTERGQQIVLSADRPPSELDGIDDRLRSRLAGGLSVAVHPADAGLRLAILARKAEMLGRKVPHDVMAFLAEKVVSNVRELEGALNRLIAHTELTGKALTIDSATDLLSDVLRAHTRRVTVEDIQRVVAEYYGIRVVDMHSPRRAREVARPRQVAMYLSKVLTEHSLPEIGRKFGGRDHTTIMHGIRKIESLLAEDQQVQDDIANLKRALTGYTA